MKPSDLSDKLPTSIGEQIHVNHKDCSAGTDSKKRLYIKMVSPNGYVYFCHHCGDKGFSYDSLSETHWDRVHQSSDDEYVSKASTVHVEDITEFEIVSYLRGYDLHDDDVKAMRLGQTSCNLGLSIPNTTWCSGETFIGQIRYFIKHVSRYHTYGTAQTNYYPKTMLPRIAGKVDYLAIVEDSISAYRVIRDGKYANAISLQGSGCNDTKVADIINKLNGATPVIWLDNDNAGKAGAIELIKKLDPLMGSGRRFCINVTGMYEEPKLLTAKRIKEIT